MTIQTPDNFNPGASAQSSAAGFASAGSNAARGVKFADLIKPLKTASALTSAGRTQTARTAAQQLVATTLVKPILSQMRRDPFRSKLFHGGQAEDMFGDQLDTIMADRITARTDFSVVGAVEREITRTGGQTPTVPPATATQILPATTGVHFDAHG